MKTRECCLASFSLSISILRINNCCMIRSFWLTIRKTAAARSMLIKWSTELQRQELNFYLQLFNINRSGGHYFPAVPLQTARFFVSQNYSRTFSKRDQWKPATRCLFTVVHINSIWLWLQPVLFRDLYIYIYIRFLYRSCLSHQSQTSNDLITLRYTANFRH